MIDIAGFSITLMLRVNQLIYQNLPKLKRILAIELEYIFYLINIDEIMQMEWFVILQVIFSVILKGFW